MVCSAYDTDDWIYRLTTMIQMAGVLVFALGIPQMFKSIEGKDYLDNTVMVWGYVIMRVAMVFQWMRAATQDPARRPQIKVYVISIVVSQIGWIVQAVSHTSVGIFAICATVLLAIEFGGPMIAEGRLGGTPWHAHHIAERYGLLIIITLGEGMIGTMAALGGLFEIEGWSLDFVLVLGAGVLITFGAWWAYFTVPCGELLRRHRDRAFGWGYGHIPIFGSVAAIGAGLHVAGYYIEYQAHLPGVHFELDTAGTVLTVAIPVGVYLLSLYGVYSLLTRTAHPFHGMLLLISAIFVVVPVFMANAGVSLPWCLVVLSLTPWVSVVGYELYGHRHNEAALANS